MVGSQFDSEAKKGVPGPDQSIILDEHIDLTRYPREIDKPHPPGTKLTFGDTHGNALNPIHFAIRRGILTLDDDRKQSINKYERLVEIYKTFNHIARDPTKKIEAQALIAEFQAILAKSKLANEVTINWSGDNLSDRGGYDISSLCLSDSKVVLDDKKEPDPKTIVVKKEKINAEDRHTICKIYARRPYHTELKGPDSDNLGPVAIVDDGEEIYVCLYTESGSVITIPEQIENKDKFKKNKEKFQKFFEDNNILERVKSAKDEAAQNALKKEILQFCLDSPHPQYEFHKSYWLDKNNQLQSKKLSHTTEKVLKKGMDEKGNVVITPISKQLIITDCGLELTPWGNDYLNLLVFNKLGMNGQFSNHDQNALQILDEYLASDRVTFLKGGQAPGNLGKLSISTARTLYYLIQLIENEVVTKDDVRRQLNQYKLGLKAFSYTLNETKDPSVLSIRPHAPVGFETIEGMAELYGIPFSKSLNKKNLCEIIDKINEKFLDDILSGRIHKKMLQRHQNPEAYDAPGNLPTPPEFPLTRLIWNRAHDDHDIVIHDTLVDGTHVRIEHGHDGPGKTAFSNMFNLDHDTGKRNLTGGQGESAFKYSEAKLPPTLESLEKKPPNRELDILLVVREKKELDGQSLIVVYYPYQGKVIRNELPVNENVEIDCLIKQAAGLSGASDNRRTAISILVPILIKKLNIPYLKESSAPYAIANGRHSTEYKPTPHKKAMLDSIQALNQHNAGGSTTEKYLEVLDHLFEAVECAEITEEDLPQLTQLFDAIRKGDQTQYDQIIKTIPEKYYTIHYWTLAFQCEMSSLKVTNPKEKFKSIVKQNSIHSNYLLELLNKKDSQINPLFSLAKQLLKYINEEKTLLKRQGYNDKNAEKLQSLNSLLIWIIKTLEQPHRYIKFPNPQKDDRSFANLNIAMQQFEKMDAIFSTYPKHLDFSEDYLLNTISELKKTLDNKGFDTHNQFLGEIIALVNPALKSTMSHILDLINLQIEHPGINYNKLVNNLIELLPEGEFKQHTKAFYLALNKPSRTKTMSSELKSGIEFKLTPEQYFSTARFRLHRGIVFDFKNDKVLYELKGLYRNLLDEITLQKWNDKQYVFFTELFNFFETTGKRIPDKIPITLRTSITTLNELGLPDHLTQKILKHFPNIDQTKIEEQLSEQGNLFVEVSLHDFINRFNHTLTLGVYETSEVYASQFIEWCKTQSDVSDLALSDFIILKSLVKKAYVNFPIIQDRIKCLLLKDQKDYAEFETSQLCYSTYHSLESKQLLHSCPPETENTLHSVSDLCWNEAIGLAVKDYFEGTNKPSIFAKRLSPFITPTSMQERKIISGHFGQHYKIPCGNKQLYVVIQNLVRNDESSVLRDYAGLPYKQTLPELKDWLLRIRDNFGKAYFDILMLQEVDFDALIEAGYPEDYEGDKTNAGLSDSQKGLNIFKAWLKLPNHFEFIINDSLPNNGLITIFNSTKLSKEDPKEEKSDDLTISNSILSVKFNYNNQAITCNNIYGIASFLPQQHEEMIKSLHASKSDSLVITGGNFNTPVYPVEHVFQECSTSLSRKKSEVFASVDGLFYSTSTGGIQQAPGECLDYQSPDLMKTWLPISVNPNDSKLLKKPYQSPLFFENHLLYSVQIKKLQEELSSQHPDKEIKLFLQKNRYNAYQLQIKSNKPISGLTQIKAKRASEYHYTLKPLENDNDQTYLFKLIEKCHAQTKVMNNKEKVLNNMFKQMSSLSKNTDSISKNKLKYLKYLHMKLSAFNQHGDFNAVTNFRNELIHATTYYNSSQQFNRRLGYAGAMFGQWSTNPTTGTKRVILEAVELLSDEYNNSERYNDPHPYSRNCRISLDPKR